MNAPYITTNSGRHVNAMQGVPSLLDIALGLSRVVRFAGQGKKFFSVAQHTLWLTELAKDEPEAVRLAILLHDAHEAIVSDIPTVFKTLEQKKLGYELDRRIFDVFYSRFGGYEGYSDLTVSPAPVERVKVYDRIGLVTEYKLIGPPAGSYLEEPAQEHVRFLDEWIRRTQNHNAGDYQREYVARVNALM